VFGQVHNDEFPQVTEQWLSIRSFARSPNGGYLVKSRCPKLTRSGRCSIHDEAPMACALYAVGGKDCLAIVKLLRTAEQYALIRDEWDPEEL
jgi:Fe-S-cluster containining protein